RWRGRFQWRGAWAVRFSVPYRSPPEGGRYVLTTKDTKDTKENPLRILLRVLRVLCGSRTCCSCCGAMTLLVFLPAAAGAHVVAAYLRLVAFDRLDDVATTRL